jgi:DNA-directed RNA polymerase specialized sigma24 family protein
MVGTNFGGLRPGRTQRPAATTRSGGSGEEYNGRSRRLYCPWRGGIGGATAYPPPGEPVPAAPPQFREHSRRPGDAGRYARLSTLITTLPSPDREILLLRVGARASIPDIVAVLGVTPAAIHRAHHQVPERTTTGGNHP